MKDVEEFIKWGLTHDKKKTVPTDAILPIPRSEVGSAGEWEYLFGTTGRKVTQSLLDSKFKKNYKSWGREAFDAATKGWVEAGKWVCDCQGVEDYFSKSDTNADGNYRRYCTNKGLVSEINRPWVLGETVFNGSSSKKTHVGWVCGFKPNGKPLIMHERGLKYGFVVTTLEQFAWKYRGLMTNRYFYDDIPEEKPMVDEKGNFIFTRILKHGCKGDDVKELKKALAAKGYTGLTLTNPNFLSSTTKVVKAYQKDNGLTIDGKVGSKTYTSLGVKFKL